MIASTETLLASKVPIELAEAKTNAPASESFFKRDILVSNEGPLPTTTAVLTVELEENGSRVKSRN